MKVGPGFRMTTIPEPTVTLASLIDKAHEDKQERPRPHLGCSTLGHDCDRWLWLSFRWAVIEKFEGRILRLFRRGQNEEATVIADLEAVGIKVTGDQMRVDFGAHLSGSTDGVATGVTGAPQSQHILEIKTHNKKSFDDLEKKGVEKSKPMHWAQMQVYMKGTKTTRALYVAICKDDDRIYTERVKYDAPAAKKLVERGHRISLAETIPDPVRADPSWYKCKWCAGHDFCYGSQTTKEINCRTCAHATPEEDSTWSCARWESKNIPIDFQHEGCDSHVLHPDLVPWERAESTDPNEAVYIIDGTPVRNGESDAFTFGSKEILANPTGCTTEFAGKVRETFPGSKVVG